MNINFDFLDDGTSYEAIIYKDAEDANYKDNPTAIAIEKLDLKKGSDLSVRLAEGGGFAISLIKK